nr:uncharacterized protein LOC125622461 isoform X2 [Caretta caretta]
MPGQQGQHPPAGWHHLPLTEWCPAAPHPALQPSGQPLLLTGVHPLPPLQHPQLAGESPACPLGSGRPVGGAWGLTQGMGGMRAVQELGAMWGVWVPGTTGAVGEHGGAARAPHSDSLHLSFSQQAAGAAQTPTGSSIATPSPASTQSLSYWASSSSNQTPGLGTFPLRPPGQGPVEGEAGQGRGPPTLAPSIFAGEPGG